MARVCAPPPLPGRPLPANGAAAVVAPSAHCTAAADFNRRGIPCIAVTLPRYLCHLAAADDLPAGTYAHTVVHESMRRTLKAMRSHRVTTVVAGSAHGTHLAEQLALELGLPGNCPDTSQRRGDRAAQAQALAAAGMAAPHGLRTNSLQAAVRWAQFCRFPRYVVAPADTSVSGPARECSSPAEIGLAWRALSRTAHRHSGGGDLIIQEWLPGAQYVVHSATGRAPDGSSVHSVREIWSETHTRGGLLDRRDLVHPSGLIHRALRNYVPRMLDALDVTHGTLRSRIAYVPTRGPILLAARPSPDEHPDRTDTRGRGRAAPAAGRHTTRVALIAPSDGYINGRLLRTLFALPTLVAVEGALHPGAPVLRTTGRHTSPGSLVLRGQARAIEADHRTVRDLEARGLYEGCAR